MPNGAPRALEAGRVTVAVSAVDWLLESDEPGIVAQARRDLLDAPDPEAEARVLEGPKVRSLLAGQRPDGGETTARLDPPVGDEKRQLRPDLTHDRRVGGRIEPDLAEHVDQL